MNALTTNRLLLRAWRPSDRAPFARLNADPVTMRYFPAPLSEAESNAMADKISALMKKRGWGFWAVEIPDAAPFIGFVGLHVPSDELPCSPCVEIGWRLDRHHWRRGYAAEAARRALEFGFTNLGLDEIVSFTAATNIPSQGVMAKIGMQCDGETFEHPAIPQGHPLRTHILYRLSIQDWRKDQQAQATSAAIPG